MKNYLRKYHNQTAIKPGMFGHKFDQQIYIPLFPDNKPWFKQASNYSILYLLSDNFKIQLLKNVAV